MFGKIQRAVALLVAGTFLSTTATLASTYTISTPGTISDLVIPYQVGSSTHNTVYLNLGTGESLEVTGTTTVGNSLLGLLFMENGILDSNSLNLGEVKDVLGLVTVAGENTVLNSTNTSVGKNGNGTLDVILRGTVTTGTCYIGENTESSGSVNVQTEGSSLEVSDTLSVGLNGTGQMWIFNQGTVSSTTCYIGTNPGADGTVTVSGADSLMHNGITYVGYLGDGTLEIQDGAKLTSDAGLYIARTSYANGSEVTVSGAGSLLESKAYTYVGHQGSGRMNITDGATVSSTNTCYIGFQNYGYATVTGAGSSLEITGTTDNDLNVGYLGNGSLYIEGGATVSVAGNCHVGGLATSRGIVYIRDTDSSLNVSGTIHIGSGINSYIYITGESVITTGSLVMYDGKSQISFDLDELSANGDYVAIDIDGLFTADGELYLSFFSPDDGYVPVEDHLTFDLFDFCSITGSFDNIIWDNWADAGYTADFSKLYTIGEVTFNRGTTEPVPEPSCIALLCVVLTGVAVMKRRY